jgi:hypothetical protein
MSTGPTPRISTPPRTPNTSAISGSNTHFSGEREKIEREKRRGSHKSKFNKNNIFLKSSFAPSTPNGTGITNHLMMLESTPLQSNQQNQQLFLFGNTPLNSKFPKSKKEVRKEIASEKEIASVKEKAIEIHNKEEITKNKKSCTIATQTTNPPETNFLITTREKLGKEAKKVEINEGLKIVKNSVHIER